MFLNTGHPKKMFYLQVEIFLKSRVHCTKSESEVFILQFATYLFSATNFGVFYKLFAIQSG